MTDDPFANSPDDETPIGAPIVFCGQCRHHDLSGDLGVHGYGLCRMRPEPERKAYFTSAENRCRIGKFEPKTNPRKD